MKLLKKPLGVLVVLALALSLAVPALAAPEMSGLPEAGDTVVLFTNDVHGAIDGYAKAAALKGYYEEQGAKVLLLDAGDFSQGQAPVNLSQGSAAVELMNMAGYDAAALGNHEFDFGYENLSKLAGEAKFSLLAANVLYDGKTDFGDSVVFISGGGTKIGVFGLSTPETKTKSHPAKTQEVEFLAGEAMFDCAQDYVDRLKNQEGCDIVLCLGHLGIDPQSEGNRSIDLLERVTSIDVFLDGHSHSTLEEIQTAVGADCMVGDTLLVSDGTQMETVGILSFDGAELTAWGRISLDDPAFPSADPAITARVQAMNEEIDALYGQVFANSEVVLNGEREPGNRTQETNLGDLICDAMLWKANQMGETVDAAITNGGGIRATMNAGDMTRRDVNTVLPFGNTLNIVRLTGEELLEALEASTYSTPTSLGGFPQVAGLVFTVDTSVLYEQGGLYPESTYYAPASIGRVSIQSVGGRPFSLTDTYTIATNDFLAAGGDTYYAFAASPIRYDLGAALDEVLMEYITQELGGVVAAADYGQAKGRITILAEQTPVVQPGQPGTVLYQVRAGDSLWGIAARELGRGTRWEEIYDLNRDVIDQPNRIYIGQEIQLPAA